MPGYEFDELPWWTRLYIRLRRRMGWTRMAYKGFDRDMRCQGCQYREGLYYVHEGDPEICLNGIHFGTWLLACEYYYPKKLGSLYHEVEVLGHAEYQDQKGVTCLMRVGRRLSAEEIARLEADELAGVRPWRRRWLAGVLGLPWSSPKRLRRRRKPVRHNH